MAALHPHVPTMMGMVIISSLMMAFSMAVVGWSRQNDGQRYWAMALLVNAVAHLLLALRGQVSDVLSIYVANPLLTCVMVGIIGAIYQFQGRRVPWVWLMVPPTVVALLMLVHADNFARRVGIVGLMLMLQLVWALLAVMARRRSTVGRGVWLLMAGLSLEMLGMLARVVMVLLDEGAYSNILQSNGLQTLTFLSTVTLVLISTMGFVFMSRERTDEANRRMATVDALTGIANRRSLLATLERDVARAKRTREPLALMMVDVDHFKRVNDHFGHPAGDCVLCCVAKVLGERVRAQDLVGRYGGEEFMVLLPDTGLAGAELLAQELCTAIEQTRCALTETQADADQAANAGGVQTLHVTVSIGVFGGRLAAGDTWDMLIAAADRALYQAKACGRNRVEVTSALRRTVSQASAVPSAPESESLAQH